MRTLAQFEFALGRRVPLGLGRPSDPRRPARLRRANAFYSRDDRGIFFGYFTGANGKPVYTCLSHDVVAHETTHAILDGLRSALPGAVDARPGGIPRRIRRHRGAAVGVLAAGRGRGPARPQAPAATASSSPRSISTRDALAEVGSARAGRARWAPRSRASAARRCGARSSSRRGKDYMRHAGIPRGACARANCWSPR